MTQWQLFLAFFRVGMLGYGGGPSSIPLVHQEVVKKYGWMDDDEFADVLALGNTLPGPIATKMAGYIGYRVAGVTGMLNALLSTILPTIVLMIVLLTTVTSFKDYTWVKGMTAAVVPVVGVMLAVLTLDFYRKSAATLGWVKSLALIALSYGLIEWLGLHPAILIAGLLLAAIGQKDKVKTSENEEKKEKQ